MSFVRWAPLSVLILVASGAAAQDKAPPIPPEKATKLSEILAKVEQRDQFRYVDSVNWDQDGFYDIVYYTTDKAKVEIKIDPVTGDTRM